MDEKLIQAVRQRLKGRGAYVLPEREATIPMTVLSFVAESVSLYASKNDIEPDQLIALIFHQYAELQLLDWDMSAVIAEPAVPIVSSVKKDTIACLECGVRLKTLRRHLGASHDITPEEYRKRWSLDLEYPLVAPEYSVRRHKLAKAMGLGGKRIIHP